MAIAVSLERKGVVESFQITRTHFYAKGEQNIMEVTAKNAKMKKYLGIVIMFALYFIVGALPPIGSITPYGMKILGITVALLWGWIVVDMVWPSLFAFVMFHLSGYLPIMDGIVAGIGNQTVLQNLILLAFAATLTQIGVSDFIAGWIISKKVFVGKPMLLIIVLMYSVLLLSVLGGGLAVIFLTWDLLRKICDANGVSTKNNLALGALMSLVVYNSMLGFILPWQPLVYVFGQFWQTGTNLTIPAMGFFYCGLVFAILSIALMLVVFKFVLRLDFSSFAITEEICEEYGKTTATIYQKMGLVLLLVYIALLLLGNFLAKVPFFAFTNALGVVGLSIIYMTIFAIWRNEKNEPVLDILKVLAATPWSIILLLAAVIPLSNALQSADTGIINAVVGVIYPLVSSLGPTGFIAVCTILLCLLTQVLPNFICAAFFFPILTPILVQMGGNPGILLFTGTAALMSAYGTPSGNMYAPLVFGSELIGKKAGYLTGWIYVIVVLVILVGLIPLWNILI